MKIINLTKEQKNNLCNEITYLTTRFKQEENVECAYVTPFINVEDEQEGIFMLTLITKENIGETKTLVEDYNQMYSQSENLEKYGLRILVNTDNKNYYNPIAMKCSEVGRLISLFNSTIIFDKTNKYTKTVELIKKSNRKLSYYENLAKIIPPITEEIKTLSKKLK